MRTERGVQVRRMAHDMIRRGLTSRGEADPLSLPFAHRIAWHPVSEMRAEEKRECSRGPGSPALRRRIIITGSPRSVRLSQRTSFAFRITSNA